MPREPKLTVINVTGEVKSISTHTEGTRYRRGRTVRLCRNPIKGSSHIPFVAAMQVTTDGVYIKIHPGVKGRCCMFDVVHEAVALISHSNGDRPDSAG